MFLLSLHVTQLRATAPAQPPAQTAPPIKFLNLAGRGVRHPPTSAGYFVGLHADVAPVDVSTPFPPAGLLQKVRSARGWERVDAAVR